MRWPVGVCGADLRGGALMCAGAVSADFDAIARCLDSTRSVHLLPLAESLPTISASAFIHPSFSSALSA